MQMELSHEYHTSPFDIRKRSFHEFCVISSRLIDYRDRTNESKSKNGTYKKVDGKLRKYVPVTDSHAD